MPPVHDPRFTDTHRQSLLEGARNEADLAHRWLVWTPLIMLGAGTLISAMIAASGEGGLVAGALAIPIYLVVTGVLAVFGVLSLLVVCVLFKSDAAGDGGRRALRSIDPPSHRNPTIRGC